MSKLTSAVSRASAGSAEYFQPFQVSNLADFLGREQPNSVILAVDKNTDFYGKSFNINQLDSELRSIISDRFHSESATITDKNIRNIILLFGPEHRGIHSHLRSYCDACVFIGRFMRFS